MRYLAIDLGAKRTGLAAGDDVVRLVQPVEVIDVPRGPALADALARAVERHGPDAVVIGLPLNMDGSEGAAAAEVRWYLDHAAAGAKMG
ncbi:MAG: RuvX/YqgF family protein [Phycisphaerales bacterium]